MRKEKCVMAFGWGIKDANFSNSYGDIYILTVKKLKDGSLKFSTIKSNGGNIRTPYARFLTKQEAEKFIQDKLPKDEYTVYQCKSERILGLVDPEYGLYMAGVSAPVGVVSPARYDLNGKQIEKEKTIKSTVTVDFIIETLKDMIGYHKWNDASEKESNFSMPSDFYGNCVEIFKDSVDLNDDIRIYSEEYINKITKLSDDQINFDCDVVFEAGLWDLENSAGTNINDWFQENRGEKDENYGQACKIYDKYRKWYSKPVNLSITISLNDFTDLMKEWWNDKEKTLQTTSTVKKALGYLIVNKLESDTSWISRVKVGLDKHIKSLLNFLDNYDKTEEFTESYNKKDIKNILYDLYENKVKY